MHKKISILLVDDQQLFREGVKQTLMSEDKFQVVGENSGNDQMIKQIKVHEPRIVIIDININLVNTIHVIKEMIKSYPETKVIVLTFNDEQKAVLKTIKIGVHGYLLKTVDRQMLIDAIYTVANDKFYLHAELSHYIVKDYQRLLITEETSLQKKYNKPLHTLSNRECEVLQLLSEGLNNQEISKRLGISLSTCKNHVNSILKKMNVNSRTLAIVKAIKNGWVKFETNPNVSYPRRDECILLGS